LKNVGGPESRLSVGYEQYVVRRVNELLCVAALVQLASCEHDRCDGLSNVPSNVMSGPMFAACQLQSCEVYGRRSTVHGILKGFPRDAKWFVLVGSEYGNEYYEDEREFLESGTRVNCSDRPDEVFSQAVGQASVECRNGVEFTIVGDTERSVVVELDGKPFLHELRACECYTEHILETRSATPSGDAPVVTVLRTEMTFCAEYPY